MMGFLTRFIASPFSGYLAIGLAAIVLTLGISLKVQNVRLRHAQTTIAKLNSDKAQLEVDVSKALAANKTNIATIKECQAVNARNTAQREAVQAKAAAAEQRAADLERQLLDSVGDTFETTDTECRKLDQPLPADFMCWLRVGTSCNLD